MMKVPAILFWTAACFAMASASEFHSHFRYSTSTTTKNDLLSSENGGVERELATCGAMDPDFFPNLDCLADPNFGEDRCTSNDVSAIGATLEAIDGSHCFDCTVGQPVTANVIVIFHSTNSAYRTMAAVWANLVERNPSGAIVNTCTFKQCRDETDHVALVPGGDTPVPMGTVSFTCGNSLAFEDTFLAWAPSSNPTCHEKFGPGEPCKNAFPKCDPTAGTIPIEPFRVTVQPTCVGSLFNVATVVTGMRGNVTYSWTKQGSAVVISTASSLQNVEDDTVYTVTVTDTFLVLGVKKNCTATASTPPVHCCTFSATCKGLPNLNSTVGATSCDYIPPAFITDKSTVFTILDSCKTPVMTHAADQESGTLCSATNPRKVLRTYILFDDLNENTVLDVGEPTLSCTQTIFLQDHTAPTLQIPPNEERECVADSTYPSQATAVMDNCDATVVAAQQNETVTMGTNCPLDQLVKTISRNFYATDCSGNTASGGQLITIKDRTDPTFDTCPSNTSMVCGTVPIPCQSAVTPAARDSCGTVTVTSDPATCVLGGIQYHWTAQDQCGNTATCASQYSLGACVVP